MASQYDHMTVSNVTNLGVSLLTAAVLEIFNLSRPKCFQTVLYFDVELLVSPRWVGVNIGSTDATKTCHTLNAYILETNNRKVINNTSLDSL
jgi:hypothetical protein